MTPRESLICLANQYLNTDPDDGDDEMYYAFMVRGACEIADIDFDACTFHVYMTEGLGYLVDEDGSYI